MKTDEPITARAFKERESYARLAAPVPFVVRLDGRTFHALAKELGWETPFDEGAMRAMVAAVRGTAEGIGVPPELAFMFSDEVSLVFLENAPFGGRVEKLASVLASGTAGRLSIDLGRPVSFDARTVLLTPAGVGDYLVWRQREAWNNHAHGHAYWALRREGLDGPAATSRLKGVRKAELHEMCFSRGINLAKTPAWQRNGVLLVRHGGEFDERWDPPRFATTEGRRLLERLITSDDRNDGGM
jgi:tRNA(His) 5'-end guanylyltransferase